MQRKSPRRLALLALFGGATGIGFAPIFVRLSEVGPSATAFYRILVALPFLWWFASLERARDDVQLSRDGSSENPSRRPGKLTVRADSRTLWLFTTAGLLFAGDLAFWHWSIHLTSVANSTLLTNCAPFFVMLGARVLFSERVTGWLLLGLGVASAGAAMLVGASFQLSPRHLLGDFLALITAGFYGGYLLTIKYLRVTCSTARILAGSGLASCAALLVITLLSGESLVARSWRGWLVLVALGLISQIGGQGLIAYALAHLPAGFSSVGLLFQPVVAAALAGWILSEGLSPLQIVGGVVTLMGIFIASRSRAQLSRNEKVA